GLAMRQNLEKLVNMVISIGRQTHDAHAATASNLTATAGAYEDAETSSTQAVNAVASGRVGERAHAKRAVGTGVERELIAMTTLAAPAPYPLNPVTVCPGGESAYGYQEIMAMMHNLDPGQVSGAGTAFLNLADKLDSLRSALQNAGDTAGH